MDKTHGLYLFLKKIIYQNDHTCSFGYSNDIFVICDLDTFSKSKKYFESM